MGSDLNVESFDAGTILEFGFNNLNPDRTYHAVASANPDGVTEPVDEVQVDCTGVTAGLACFGFLDVTTMPSGYLSVSFGDDTNTVVTAITPSPTTTIIEPTGSSGTI